MKRFTNLPSQDEYFLFCMICLTNVKERYENYINERKKIPKLALFDAITPLTDEFQEKCLSVNFHKRMTNEKGSKGCWLSIIEIFSYFIQTNHKYLVVLEDDAKVPKNIENILKLKYINDEEYLKLGGIRLGPYCVCNLYNKSCVQTILNTIKMKEYPIDRNLDHYVSNIGTGTGEKRPFLVHIGKDNECMHLPSTLVKVVNSISQTSERIKYDRMY